MWKTLGNTLNYKTSVLIFEAVSLSEWDHYKTEVPEIVIGRDQDSGSSSNPKELLSVVLRGEG